MDSVLLFVLIRFCFVFSSANSTPEFHRNLLEGRHSMPSSWERRSFWSRLRSVAIVRTEFSWHWSINELCSYKQGMVTGRPNTRSQGQPIPPGKEGEGPAKGSESNKEGNITMAKWRKRSNEDEIMLELIEAWKEEKLKGPSLETRFVQSVSGYH